MFKFYALFISADTNFLVTDRNILVSNSGQGNLYLLAGAIGKVALVLFIDHFVR